MRNLTSSLKNAYKGTASPIPNNLANLIEAMETIIKWENKQKILRMDLLEAKNEEQASAIRAEQKKIAEMIEGGYRDGTIKGNIREIHSMQGRGYKPSCMQKRIFEEIRSKYLEKNAIPAELAIKAEMLENQGRGIHSAAKKEGGKAGWEMAKAHLTEVIECEQEIHKHFWEAFGSSTPADSALRLRSPGVTTQTLDGLFKSLIAELPQIHKKAKTFQAENPIYNSEKIYVPADKEKFIKLANRLGEILGLDPKRAKFTFTDKSSVEGGTRDDARANVVWDDKAETVDLLAKTKTIVHEIGHMLYFQGTPEEYYGSPLGEDQGGVMHEAQANFIEMVISRTPEFSELLAQTFEEIFEQKFDAEQIYNARIDIDKSAQNRIGAHETIYDLYVIAHWNAYKNLVNGDISIDNYPQALADEYKNTVGIEIPEEEIYDLALRDVHVYVRKGALYPSYTVGNIIAAQQYGAIRQEIPDLSEKIRSGDLKEITNWCRDNIYEMGQIIGMQKTVQEATGFALNPSFRLAQLEERYLGKKMGMAIFRAPPKSEPGAKPK
jgi:carboxypeptidase Taq